VKRWVSNVNLPLNAARYEWVRWAWSKYGGARAVLLVDETKLGDRFGVMLVSLAYAGRAIPLWWRAYRANDAEAYPHLAGLWLAGAWVKCLTRTDASAGTNGSWAGPFECHAAGVGVARRGLLGAGQVQCRFTSRNGTSQLLKHWVRVGQSTQIHGTLFDRDHACAGTICLIWEVGQAEA